ncbi:uncharacterized protein LOC124647347 [Lolium rigidum]|uniref:uncharacterized protein LOC124647347 n=1 Tax=Lolium rigidum TaxID=89674 RepID=UPI001F5E006F|nr:uncharacterized protein LOC124647347 [Lolium rigidum]
MVVTGVAAGVVTSKIGDRETWDGGGGVERRCLWVVKRLGWSDAAIPATVAHDMEVNKAASIWVIRDISPCITTRAADVSAEALAWESGHALLVLGAVFFRRSGAALAMGAAVARHRSRSGVRWQGGGRRGGRVGSVVELGKGGWELSPSARSDTTVSGPLLPIREKQYHDWIVLFNVLQVDGDATDILARRKLRGETGGHGCRCRHFHVHYHLPRKRVCTFSLLRWLPCFSLFSCVLIPLVLFFVVLAFVVSFVWFTLLYFVAYLLNKDSDHGSFKNGSFGRASGDVDNHLLNKDSDQRRPFKNGSFRRASGDVVDNHLREDCGQQGNREAKGKAVKHAAELLAGDPATSVACAKKLKIKEVHVDGLSEVSPNISRILSSGASLNCEVPTSNGKFFKKLSTFETATEVEPDDDLKGFSEPADGFVDEHNIRLVSGSESGDSSPYVYSLNSAPIHDLPDMNEVIEMSSDFLVGSNQNMVVPSNTSPHHYISDTNSEYGEDLFEDRKELSDCTPYGIIDFIDKHETTDQALDSSFATDQASSAGSAHGRIPDEHSKESTEEEDAESVLEFLVDSVATLEDFDEQRVPEIPITEAGTEQSVAASNEMHGFSNENETSELSLCSVCDDTVFSDAPSPHDNDCADDRQQEATENNIGAASDPASVACDFVENHQTATRALDDSANGGSTQEVVSRESSEGEADKVNDNSSTEGTPRGRPLLRRSPSQWWNLCGVVDVFAGSAD